MSFDIDPFILGVYRAVLGLFLLLYYAMLAPRWQMYYGPDGISMFTGSGVGYQFPAPIMTAVSSAAGMWVLYGASVAAAVCLASGLWTRVALAWLWVMNHSLLLANIYVVNGEEQVLAVLLLLSLLLPLDRSFTLPQLVNPDRRKAMFRASGKVTVWALAILQAHIALVYLLGLPAKLGDDTWREGLVVYYAMMAIDYPRWPGMQVFAWADAAVSRALTYGTLIVELAVPILIWFRRLRAPCALGAMGLHLGLAILLEGVAMFNAAMIVALVAFLPSRRTREWIGRRLDRRGGRPVSERAPAGSTGGGGGRAPRSRRRRRAGSAARAGGT